MNPLSDFMKSAKGLTKNPLGIIGLFISLIYGFACLVLSTSISNLESANERIPLIWFIIIFPLIILGAFLFLVVNHHEKLYAPSDFRDDGSFIETMQSRRINEKKDEEINLLVEAKNNKEISKIKPPITQNEEEVTIKGNSNKITKLSVEELKERYIKSEKWAIKDLELEYNVHFKTNQVISSNGIKLELDAYAITQNQAIISEVKYWQSDKATKPLLLNLQKFILKFDQFQRAFKSRNLELIIVIVFDKLTEKNTQTIKKFVNELNDKVKIQFKEYENLLNDYKE
eukprot:TRINITY_DN938_c0_g1_i1.p1 TRINITY_DN938_c0_g1~~TRINITY_DN938_c0_g1_i1.p1  ORF type:complete len:286 (-),score=43.20 TRINITY_DN938_c0_g1_i1:882-1739(-)